MTPAGHDKHSQGPSRGRKTFPAFVLNKDIQITLEDEKALLNFVRMCSVTLARLNVHNRQCEIPRWDYGRIIMLSRPTRTDETVLRALEALNLGVFKSCPIRFLFFEAAYIFFHNIFDMNVLKFF